MPEEQNSMSRETTRQTVARPVRSAYGIPVAIVLAAALIAGAIIYTGQNAQKPAPAAATQKAAKAEIAPVTEKDHILGNPNAPIMIVEYSDFDCPFCRIFHDTMSKIMADYGKDGKVAWVFRQFPIVGLHPSAPKIAQASECAADLGGNDAFWKFSDALNGSRKIEYGPNGALKSVEPTNVTRLSEFAVAGGVDKTAFEQCLNSDKHVDQIQADIAAAAKAGAQGTPYSIILVGDQQVVINGAQPYETVKQMLDTLIAQLGE